MADCLHRLFEAQAHTRPSAPAVIDEHGALTYDALNRRANQLARRLRALGVDRGVLVGVCLHRTADIVVAILAILKAGGAYLPLDPSYPRERLSLMLQDAEPRVVLIHEPTRGAVADASGSVVAVDTDATALADESADDLPDFVTADDLAYVIYTSGSTGTPKGALVTHANVVSLFDGSAPLFAFSDRDVWTCIHSISFDYSVWEIFGALLYGGELVVVPFLISRSPSALLALLAQKRVTVLNLTPPSVLALIDADRASDHIRPLSLRLFMYGGEALDPVGLKPWFERRGDRQPRLVNLYGITETTVIVTYRLMSSADAEQGTRSIGLPVPGFAVHVLDASLAAVPDGDTGELCVGGPGVGRGYWKRPDLTERRFVPDPFADDGDARLYRSGDLARRLPNGEIEFLGRIDNQVKIRGFRVETGEIEAALRKHPAVRQCVVRTYTHAAQDVRLCAYIVPIQTCQAGTDRGRELRSFLAQLLPEYMVPSRILFVDSIPLTINGKIDTAALPAPPASADDEAEFEADPPRTPVEAALALMFADLLGATRVGRTTDFFERGGNSLAAMKLVARITERFGIEISMGIVLENRTVETLAQYLDPVLREQSQIGEPRPIAPVPLDRVARYPLSFAQQDILTPSDRAAASRRSGACVFELDEPIDEKRLARAFRHLIQRHELLRTSFDTAGLSQRVNAEAPFTLQARHATLDEALARRQLFAEPFDVTTPPLMRAELIHLPDGGGAHLLLDLHDAVTDAVSLPILTSELWALYARRRLDPVALHYKDYAVWQDACAISGAFGRDEAFWQEAFDGFVWTEVPASAVRSSSPLGETTLHVDEGVRRKVLAACERGRTSDLTIGLAAVNATLSEYTGEQDITLGVRLSRRTDTQLARMLGPFVEDSACRVIVPEVHDLPAVTSTTARALDAALDHAMYPYARLNQSLQRRRPTPNGELFTVLVDWQPPAPPLNGRRRARATTLPRPSTTTSHITLRFHHDRSLRLDAEYRGDRYSETFMQGFLRDVVSTMDRMADHLRG